MATIINLSKDMTQKIDLTKGTSMTAINFGAGWDSAKGGLAPIDGDIWAYPVNAEGKVIDNFPVYWNKENRSAFDGAIALDKDDQSGEGEDTGIPDENILIKLRSLPANVKRVKLVFKLYEGEKRNQTFGCVSGAFAEIRDASAVTSAPCTPDYTRQVSAGEIVAKFDMQEDFSNDRAVYLGDLYEHGGEWKFETVGKGFANENDDVPFFGCQ